MLEPSTVRAQLSPITRRRASTTGARIYAFARAVVKRCDGMTLAEKIHAELPAATMIFITSHQEYAISAYEFAIFRYIPKTQLAEKLPQALADFYKLYALERGDFYTIAVKNHVEKLAHRDILYVLKDGKYAVFYLRGGRTAQVRKSLSEVAGELGPPFSWRTAVRSSIWRT